MVVVVKFSMGVFQVVDQWLWDYYVVQVQVGIECFVEGVDIDYWGVGDQILQGGDWLIGKVKFVVIIIFDDLVFLLMGECQQLLVVFKVYYCVQWILVGRCNEDQFWCIVNCFWWVQVVGIDGQGFCLNVVYCQYVVDFLVGRFFYLCQIVVIIQYVGDQIDCLVDFFGDKNLI